MASGSRQPATAAKKSTLTRVLTLRGHKGNIPSVSYFPDGRRMISGSDDKTTRRWDLEAGKEIEEARDVYKEEVFAVAVSRDDQWVVTAGGDYDRAGELKVCKVETGIVRTFKGHTGRVNCIDISTDSTLLASGSRDFTVRIWSLDTGKLVAGPLKSDDKVGAVRFSQNSKKLAVKSDVGRCLEVWDVQTQKLDVRVGKYYSADGSYAPVFWTTKDKSIVAVFSFTLDDSPKTIYEFEPSTLDIVGTPFEGHTDIITGLALSFDCALLASASRDDTIKLWAFKSRQLLASFHVQYPRYLILSPDSHRLAYTTRVDANIYICDTPPEVLRIAGVRPAPSTITPKTSDILNSDATRRVRRNPARLPVISSVPRSLRPPPTIHPQQHIFVRYLRKFLPSRMNAVSPVRNNEPRDLLDFPATSPLPRNWSSSAQATTQTRLHIDPYEDSRRTVAPPTNLSTTTSPTTFKARLSTWWPVRAGHTLPPIVDVPLAQGKERNAAAGAPKKDDDDLIRDEDYVPPTPPPNPNLQQPPNGGQIRTGEHGSGRLCGCF